MADGHCFISYSTADAKEFARKLADELQGGEDTFIKTWFDKRDIDPARDWDDQIVEGIRACKCMVFVMTKDSTAQGSMCKNEWNWALKYKKPVVPILLQKGVEQPFGLGNRQWIDFTGDFDHGLSKLRLFLRDMDSPKGVLQSLKDRHADAERDLRRAKPEDQLRIQAEIEELDKQIESQQKIVDNPQAAQEQTQKNIEAGLERERKPEKPTAAQTSTKFINPPPGLAPTYFQDRIVETGEAVKFLQDDAQRLMTIVGRGGVGKTAMVCRLLKGLEGGELPDGLGRMRVEGIVYLSESGSHRVNFANLFYDLCKLLPSDAAQELDAVYKNPQGSTESKMRALLEKFGGGRVVALLDNFEPLVDTETFAIRDAELDEALRAFLNGTHSAVKVVITTRVAPRALNLIQPGRQRGLTLDEGLESPYAENILREMDSDGRLGLKSAGAEALNRARIKTRGFPRALEALFAILASDRYTTLEELLAMPLPENVVEALVGEAFNRLDTNAQKVMQALAVYNRPVTPAAVDYLLAPHIPAMDSAPILQRLANMHFARKESGRFYLHPVDREFAFGLVPEGEKRKTKNVKGASYDLRFTQYALLDRAADYFAQARKPRAEWKKLEDLSAQLAEFDLRCAAGDYDTAASVLGDIDFDYLFLWGHYRLMIDLHEKLQGNINDSLARLSHLANLGNAYRYIGQFIQSIKIYEEGLENAKEAKTLQAEGAFLGGLGNVYHDLSNPRKAIEFNEQALGIAREIGNRRDEEVYLGNLGSNYATLGDARKSLEFYEQALVIDREIGNRKDEGADLGNLGSRYLDLGDASKAIELYEQALVINREIGYRSAEEIGLINLACAFNLDKQYSRAIASAKQSLLIAIELGIPASYEYGILSEAYLLSEQLDDALINAKQAQKFNEPQNNHNASALHGIIALRQGDEVAARGAFVRAIGQADEILSKTAEYYDALDAKGLAICGLAIADDGRRTMDDDPTGTLRSGQSSMVYRQQAIETFQQARKIAPHAGVVKSVLRLFDELVKCDEAGILKDVRKAVEGIEG